MAEANVSALLSEFSGKAARLNAASDSLNSILAKVEAQIIEANLGIEVWLRRALTSTDPESSGGEMTWTAEFLGLAKLNGKWCLAVKPIRFASGFFEGDTDSPYQNEYKAGEPIRLDKASREIRIAALENLPSLIELLIKEADRCIDTVHQARKLVV